MRRAVRCANCGTELLEGKKFCHACGAPVASACPRCSASVTPGFRFCPECGFGLAGGGAPAAESPAADRFERLAAHAPAELTLKIRERAGSMAGERKLVTVLFCDLVGSTSIAERLDPEEYHDLLDEYLALAFREVYRVEGIVNQLAGDGFMALFGAPIAHEDAPHRAVSAALAVRDAVAALSESVRARRGLDLRVRIGIHTGPVVVGAVGSDLKTDYSAIGDTTNLAARLQSLAEPGTVLASEATYRLVRGFFEARAIGPLAVKGKREPVAAFEVAAEIEARTPMAIAEARGLTPLVGRGEEVAQLVACWSRIGGLLAQLVAVVGDAGSGKSRLLYEFRQRIAGEEMIVFEARSSALSRALPYAPIAGMLRQYFGIAPGEAAEVAREKMARGVRERDPELADMLPFLCRLLALDGEGLDDRPADEIKRGTFEAVVRLVEQASRRAPVLVVFEDLHWVDDSSREMVELAVSRLRRARIMILVSHRPDFQPAWRPQAAFTQLQLRRLTEAEAAEMAGAVAGGRLPDELGRAIVARAEGNPFYLEELTRALLEEGQVARDDGEIRLARPISEMRVPATVHELLAARLDRLGVPAKRVVQVASVLGRQFRRSDLARLLSGEAIAVERELEALERRGLVHRKTAASDDDYRFGESLTQEIAYEGLLLKERRQLHGRVAELVESSREPPTAERSALLAHHLSRSDDHRRALDALLRAAGDAERIPSFAAAAGFYRQAWELAESGLAGARGAAEDLRRQTVAAALGLCRMAAIYGAADLRLVETVATRARKIAEDLGDVESQVLLASVLGNAVGSLDRERFAEGLEIAEQGFALAERSGLGTQMAMMSRGVAWLSILDGRFETAERLIREGIEAMERAGHRERLSDVYFAGLFGRVSLSLFRGDLAEAFPLAEDALALAMRAGNRTAQGGTASYLAWIHVEWGRYAEALEWAEKSLEISSAAGNVSAVRTAAAIAISARAALGDTTSAARYVDLVEQGYASHADMALKSHLAVGALLALGEAERALRFAEISWQHAGGRLREMWNAAALGDATTRLGAFADADGWYGRAVERAGEIGSRLGLAAALAGAAELAIAQGDRERGLATAREGLVIAETAGFVRMRERAERLLEGTSAAPAGD